MGLHDDGRELSPLSDLDKVHSSKSDMGNHFNKFMKRSVTDTIRDHAGDHDDYYSDMPVVQIQKPAYIPGQLSAFPAPERWQYLFNIFLQSNDQIKPIIKNQS